MVGTSAMIFAIMIGASLFGFVLTILQVPQALTMMVAEVEVSRWVFFILINLLLLFLGCILETVSIIFITVPILYPIIKQLGFDPIWFNVVMQINMEMALITPPVGMNLFVLKGVSPESRMEDIIRGVIHCHDVGFLGNFLFRQADSLPIYQYLAAADHSLHFRAGSNAHIS